MKRQERRDKFCRNCVLREWCSFEQTCWEYTPRERKKTQQQPEPDNEAYIDCVESKRKEFHSAWWSYIKDWE